MEESWSATLAVRSSETALHPAAAVAAVGEPETRDVGDDAGYPPAAAAAAAMYLTTVVLVSATIALLAYLIRIRRQKLKVFANLGVNGPEPNILFGNLDEFAKKRSFEVYADWTRAFGKTYGVYEGSAPVLVTSDPDILRDVYVKKFSHFFGRRLFPVQPEPDTGADKEVHILFSRGHRWKRLRTTISPTFSNIKMKQMFPLVKVCVDHTVDVFCAAKAETGEEFDIHGMMQGMTLDVIASCAFGLSPVFQRNEDDPILLRCRRLFEDFARKPWIMILGALFPEGRNFWWKMCKLIASYTYDDMDWLYTNLSSVIEARRQQSAAGVQPGRVDLLQLLLDAEVVGGSALSSSLTHLTMTDGDDRAPATGSAGGANHSGIVGCGQDPPASGLAATKDSDTADAWAGPRHDVAPAAPPKDVRSGQALPFAGHASPAGCPAQSKGKLSKDEVIANSVVFLVGGYETTSNLISYVAYEMAMHPQCQSKLQSELDDALATEDGFTYEIITHLPYLEMVVSEALRMYPMGMFITGRICMKDVEVGGLPIPQGMMVQPDVWSLHHDPVYWGDSPNEFDPDRFLPEAVSKRDPMVYLPFGAGPKNCVGMRFALTECKFAIARLLSKYTVLATPRTRVELIDGAALNPKNGIIVKLVERN